MDDARDAYDSLQQVAQDPESFGMVRDTEREEQLARDEAVLLRLVEQSAERGEISKDSAQTFTLYLRGSAATIQSWKAPPE